MVKTVKVISAFVASPSDVNAERQVLTRVMDELNLTWMPQFDVRLEVVKWETHAHPGVGADAQAVINSQLGSDCDIFIGILWSRIGTPTPRGRSGTVEEFEQVYNRFKHDPNSVQIMIYLKQAPIAPDQIDPDQLKQLNEFREELQTLGILYTTFKDTAEFEQLARVHLGKVMGGMASEKVRDVEQLTAIKTAEQRPSAQSSVDLDDPDIGFLDLDETFEHAVATVADGLHQITAATRDIATHVSLGAANLNAAQNTKNRKQVVEQIAAHTNDFASTVERLLPGIREAQQRMAISGARRITLFGGATQGTDAEAFYRVIGELITRMASTRSATGELRASVAQTPRATASMNRAKRRMVKAIDDLLDFYDTGQKLIGAMKDATPHATVQHLT